MRLLFSVNNEKQEQETKCAKFMAMLQSLKSAFLQSRTGSLSFKKGEFELDDKSKSGRRGAAGTIG